MTEKKFLIATNNAHKIKEFKKIFDSLGLLLVTPKELGISCDPEENGTTFEENSLIKAREFFKLSGIPTVADDSGLCVDALQGEPGIYSARYGGFDDDTKRLYFLLSNLEGEKNRNAHFNCTIACILDEDNQFTVSGKAEGTITDRPSGDCGFGYDPVFLPNGYDKTFAQMTEDEKNKISHRANALKAFARKLKEIY